ncbi:pilus assembly protein TadG-related protein [Emcibacter sp. SYSU 3D8]|uniref:TadE/TadG family type IV pilus assembly protein n=1 Tax=Emcibacter sp. SYSU 3D8 TaxID=3133969 RepID=UPI0031FF0B8D
MRDRRANIAIIVGLSLPVLLATFGLAFEIGQWYMNKWRMQNAADSAVIAAVNNSSNYVTEARAVTAQYGYIHGADNVTVAVTNTATCPTGSNDCYQVTIDKPTDLYLSPMVGFQGSTVVNGKKMQNLSSAAMARQAATPREYCILALAGSGVSNGIRTNGAPQATMPGCDIMSNTNATCNGHNLNVDIGDAAGTNSGCGAEQNSNMPVVADPYSGLAANIPANTCTAAQVTAGVTWSSNQTLSGNVAICGDLKLLANVTVSAPTNAVLIIYNGALNLNGFTLQATSGSGMTLVFAGDNGSYTHAPIGNGMLDFAAPTTGAWKGMAIYQAPNLTSGVDISEAGNTPAWKITGMAYLPNAAVTLKGIVNKASYGASCFGLVVDSLLFAGTSAILAHGECSLAGLDLPYNTVLSRAALVN